MDLTQCVALIHYWSHGISIKTTVALIGLSKQTVTLWHKVSLHLNSICPYGPGQTFLVAPSVAVLACLEQAW